MTYPVDYATTMAIGEEESTSVTSMMVGEEESSQPTTLAYPEEENSTPIGTNFIGEEGGMVDGGWATTLAIPEDGNTGYRPVTLLASEDNSYDMPSYSPWQPVVLGFGNWNNPTWDIGYGWGNNHDGNPLNSTAFSSSFNTLVNVFNQAFGNQYNISFVNPTPVSWQPASWISNTLATNFGAGGVSTTPMPTNDPVAMLERALLAATN
jgi:hypothetical protein